MEGKKKKKKWMRTERGGVEEKRRDLSVVVVPSCRGIRAMLMEIHRSFSVPRLSLSIFAHFKQRMIAAVVVRVATDFIICPCRNFFHGVSRFFCMWVLN